MTAVYRSRLKLPGAPAALVDQARTSFAVAIHAGGSTGAHARQAFVDGIHTGLLCAACAAILAAIAVAGLLRGDARVRRPGEVSGDLANPQLAGVHRGAALGYTELLPCSDPAERT